MLLLFGSPEALSHSRFQTDLAAMRSQVRHWLGCSTAGEICGQNVLDDTVVATAIRFERTTLRLCARRVGHVGESTSVGREIGQELTAAELTHVFVLSDGLGVNGSALVAGLTAALPPAVTVTGGLSADGDRFRSTLVLADGPPEQHLVAAVGLYGQHLRVACGSMGGWDPFGPDRLITRAEGNVLYELDGKSALALYRRYLGNYAGDLPASGLLFPLLVRPHDAETGVVRTILSIDEAKQSMTFAGDLPQGGLARLMKANFDRLIDGATGAALRNRDALGATAPELALLISCVGRKLVLRQRIDEEVEAVREVLGTAPTFAGFYSYGEISPFRPGARCDLHNQTMTITTMAER